MPDATPRPAAPDLRQFLLGTLPPAEAERAAAWVGSSPDAARALAGVAAHDALTKAVADTARVRAVPAEVIDSVVRRVAGQSPEAESVSGGGRETRARLAGGRAPAGTADWAPAPASEFIGEFRVVRELGSGGMGVVYEAVDEQLDRRAAVKVLGPAVAGDPDARRRFLREARALARLDSPHVVKIYQVGEEGGLPFLAMEYIEGLTLDGWLKTRAAPVAAADVLWAARGLLTGLAAAHQAKCIHRDIKPGNVMVVKGGRQMKVLDFGLTRHLDESSSLTSLGAVSGTPAYMSPEQARGEALDARTDLFSTGVVLHRMVRGRSPFQRDSVFATVAAVATAPPPAPLRELPAELNAFLARLMAPERDGRPADATAALAELDAIEARLATSPAPRGKAGRGGGKTRLLVGLAAVLLVAAAAVVIIIRDKHGRERGRIELPDGVVKGGKVEVVDPNSGKKTTVPIPPGKERPKVEPVKEPEKLGELRKGARVVATSQTSGFEDDTSGVSRLVVPRGMTGTVTEFSESKNYCRVRLDNADKDEVWISRRCIEVK